SSRRVLRSCPSSIGGSEGSRSVGCVDGCLRCFRRLVLRDGRRHWHVRRTSLVRLCVLHLNGHGRRLRVSICRASVGARRRRTVRARRNVDATLRLLLDRAKRHGLRAKNRRCCLVRVAVVDGSLRKRRNRKWRLLLLLLRL